MERIPVTNEERDLVFELAMGMPQVLHMIGHIRLICMDAQNMDYMNILRWLKRNNLKGWELKSWMEDKQRGSLLQAIAYVRKEVHSDFSVKKIYAIKPI